MQLFEVYLSSTSVAVSVFCDEPACVLMHWSLLLQDFNLEMCYKKGVNNVVAAPYLGHRCFLSELVSYVPIQFIKHFIGGKMFVFMGEGVMII